MNLALLWRENIKTFGRYVNLIYQGREFTNVECNEVSAKLANQLHKLGIGRGDRVLVSMPNCPEVVFAYSGIIKAGAVVVPAMPLLQPDEIRYIVKDSRPKAVLTMNMLLAKIEEAVRDLPDSPEVYSLDEGGGPDSFRSQMEDCPTTPPSEIPADDDLAVLLYTSGTTGRPKGVMLSHRNLYSNAKEAAELAKAYPLKSKRVGLGILPLSHAFGFTTMITTLLLGETDVLLPYFDPVQVFQAIERYKVTHFTAVPAMFYALYNHPDADKYDLSSLSVCVSGSAPLPQSLSEDFEKKFDCRIYEGYGLSEASPIVTAPRPDLPVKPGSVGLPLPGVEVKVVDDSGRELPRHEVGELLVRGPNVTRGYYNMPDETRAAIQDGWLHTGDMARIDEEGYVYIVDRKKDLIIRGGFNIYPRDLEELLLTHPAVAEVGVVGTPSDAMGEEVVAYVVKHWGADTSEEELIEFCQRKLAKYKTPRYIRFVGYLPRNLIGKVDKKILREWAADIGVVG
ncbi:MAG: long-chain fatty acid--CoA ligase [Alicyclobacillus herbarius]|uniref:long-chain-fatty-acid--CoA ligase n=1 Tax=Alicyclobacillus herbarius TaxID=122960 RepID=UPI002357F7B5|nr:long-chain fatty acid--CoA ligase [Alicyclobacillus herbarius]MCL6632931.1 long-chain fatty acid--CoA ligase [Alicyclobacillus herbarius]